MVSRASKTLQGGVRAKTPGLQKEEAESEFELHVFIAADEEVRKMLFAANAADLSLRVLSPARHNDSSKR
jgi:hypothetical protein